MKPRLVAILWNDSHSHPAGWAYREDLKPSTMTVLSVGWIMVETDEALVLSSHLTEEQAATPITIPRSAIVRLRRMKWPMP